MGRQSAESRKRYRKKQKLIKKAVKKAAKESILSRGNQICNVGLDNKTCSADRPEDSAAVSSSCVDSSFCVSGVETLKETVPYKTHKQQVSTENREESPHCETSAKILHPPFFVDPLFVSMQEYNMLKRRLSAIEDHNRCDHTNLYHNRLNRS